MIETGDLIASMCIILCGGAVIGELLNLMPFGMMFTFEVITGITGWGALQ